MLRHSQSGATNELVEPGRHRHVLSEKPIAAEFEESLKLQYNEVHVVEVGNSLLGNLPAHVFRVRYSSGTPSGEVFSYALMGSATRGQFLTSHLNRTVLGEAGEAVSSQAMTLMGRGKSVRSHSLRHLGKG